jgi:hypothetical protein
MIGRIDHVPLALLPPNVLLRPKRRGKIAAKKPAPRECAREGGLWGSDAEYA